MSGQTFADTAHKMAMKGVSCREHQGCSWQAKRQNLKYSLFIILSLRKMEHTWKLRSKRTFRLGSSRAVANLVPLITMCLAKCACLAHQTCLAPPGSVCLIWNLWSLWSFPTRMTFGDGYGLNWTLLSLAFLRTPPAQNLRSHVVRRQDLPRSNWVKRRA